MASLNFGDQMYNREVAFCNVYSLDGKEKLEKLFLQNRISYFIEWQNRSLLSRLFASDKHKNVLTVRINEADVERAADLVRGIESVKLKNIKED